MSEHWTPQRHEKMLKRIDKLMFAKDGTLEAFELDWLVGRVIAYEDVHCPIGAPE